MILLTSLFSMLCWVSSAHASDSAGFARVLAIAPSATFDGKKIPEDSLIAQAGIVKTASDGGAKISFPASRSIVDIAANSEVKIFPPTVGAIGQSIEVLSGMARARVTPAADAKIADKPVFTLRSKAATMGVRGTDFLGIANPILNEAEIIVFEGKVEFTSTADLKDSRTIAAGYWGGVGGRFGAKTVNPIQLPKAAIDHFNRVSQGAPAFTVKPATDDKKSESTGHGG